MIQFSQTNWEQVSLQSTVLIAQIQRTQGRALRYFSRFVIVPGSNSDISLNAYGPRRSSFRPTFTLRCKARMNGAWTTWRQKPLRSVNSASLPRPFRRESILSLIYYLPNWYNHSGNALAARKTRQWKANLQVRSSTWPGGKVFSRGCGSADV